MKRAGTGGARFPFFRGVPDAAAYVLEFAIIAASYAAVAEAMLVLPGINPTEPPLWPLTGLGLSLLLLRGYRIWPAITLGSFSYGALTGRSFLAAGSIGIGAVLAGLAGAWLIERWSGGRRTFDTPRRIATFALVCFVPTALIGSAAVRAGLYPVDAASLGDAGSWAVGWLANATGALVIAPVLVLWATMPLRPVSERTLTEATAVVALAAVIGVAAFAPLPDNPVPHDLQPHRSLLGFLVVVPLLWAGLRGNRRNAVTAAAFFCAAAASGFAARGGASAEAHAEGSLLMLLALSITVPTASLIFSAAIAVRRDTEMHLRAVQDQLINRFAETNRALESSKRHFQILIEGVVDYAIFVLDTAGRVASWNDAARQIIGYVADEVIGKHFGIFYRPDERRAGEPNRALELAIREGKHAVEGWRIRKDGTLFFATGSVSSILDNDGNLIGFANVIRDATERRDTQEKLVQAREQLAMAQKMEAIGKLTGGIAHDFNNLLMIIGGNAQTFKRLLDPKLPRALEAIQTAAKRGESLTRQLLTFARRQHLSPTVVDLNACIANMRTMIESSLRGNIVYNENSDPNVWPVKVDLAELELAIVNIAVNARDAMPNGGAFTIAIGNVSAHADDRRDSEFVAVEFSDTGTGIPPDLLSKIFDPFFTTKEVGKGSGLGLSQVYGFAHQSGGMVKADSKIGQGTTIQLYLPALPAAEITPEDADAMDAVETRRRPAVLIVDDSAEVAEVTSALFDHLGYDTLYRELADAALKLLADGARVDLVFSDIVMPGTIDGVGLASEIRSQYPDLPVLLTTGYSDAARAAPADLRILRKPFDTNALRGFIREAVESRLAN